MDEWELRRNWDLSAQLLRRVLMGCHSWQGIFSVTHSTLQKINGQTLVVAADVRTSLIAIFTTVAGPIPCYVLSLRP
jgi:hypothetical protein